MKIREKFLLVFFGIFILVSVLGLLALQANRQIMKSFEGDERDVESMFAAASGVSSHVKKVESSLLFFLGMGDEQSRRIFFREQTALSKDIVMLDRYSRQARAREMLETIKKQEKALSATGTALLEAYDQNVQGAGTFTPERYGKSLQTFLAASRDIRNLGVQMAHFETSYLNRQEQITAASEVSNFAKRVEGHLLVFLMLHGKADREKVLKSYAALTERVSILNEKANSADDRAIVSRMASASRALLPAVVELLRVYDAETAAGRAFDLSGYQDALYEISDFVALLQKLGDRLAQHNLAREIRPREAKVEQVKYQQYIIFASVFICLFIALMFGYGITSSITRPLLRLKATVAEFGSGRFDVRAGITSKDEVGVLAETFNRMAGDLLNVTVSKDYFENILQSMIDSLIVTTPEGIIQNVNWATCDLLGYHADELIGQPLSMILGSRFSQVKMFEVLMRQGVVRELDRHYVKKDGSRVSVHLAGSVMRGRNDSVEAFICIAQDISERKRIEAEKNQMAEQLQRARQMEAIGTLAGGVSHDLNNILGGIVSYPELLLLNLPQDSPLRTPILTIQESGQKAAAIVQDMLTLARRGVAVSEVMNLNDIIVAYLGSPEYKKLKSFHPGVSVEPNLAADLSNSVGSPVHLSKTVMNLVSNAVEATSGDGRVGIETANVCIDRPLKGSYGDIGEGEYVLLSVSDNGIGISATDLEKIFEPFYSKKVMGKSGTGLGMSVVWGTVQDHKGSIDVHSEEGRGTTFKLYFPATAQEKQPEQDVVCCDEYAGHGEKILVVDDVALQREVAVDMLTRLNYDVAAVASGEDAVDYIMEQPVDLVILDMIMDPGIDGLETYKLMLEIRPGQRAIIASGFSESERVKEAETLGAGAYIKKPYTLEKIGMAVKTELQSQGVARRDGML